MPEGAQLSFEGQDALYEDYDIALSELDAAKINGRACPLLNVSRCCRE